MSIGTAPNAPADRRQLLAVLPEEVLHVDGDGSDNRAFLRLPHPRNNQPSLYLPYKPKQTDDKTARTHGLLEVQKVEPNARRSWFLDQAVLSDGSLLLFTPIDPLFLIIPLVASLLTTRSKSTDAIKSTAESGLSPTLKLESDEKATREDRFLPLDDLISEASRTEGYRLAEPFAEMRSGEEGEKTKQEEWMGNEDVIALCRLEGVRSRLKDACETQCFDSSDVSEESTFYRASPLRILQLLRTKITALASPATFSSFPSLVKQILRNGLDEEVLEAYKTALEPTDGDGKEREVERRRRVAEQARTRVACEIVGQYLLPDVFQTLVSSYDFSLLEQHLDTQAAVAFASSHAVSGKTNGPSATSDPAAKPGVKRKGSGQGSRGVEKLKKVNTSKMPKLTSFFTKKPKE